jgi:hypothetical protein
MLRSSVRPRSPKTTARLAKASFVVNVIRNETLVAGVGAAVGAEVGSGSVGASGPSVEPGRLVGAGTSLGASLAEDVGSAVGSTVGSGWAVGRFTGWLAGGFVGCGSVGSAALIANGATTATDSSRPTNTPRALARAYA